MRLEPRQQTVDLLPRQALGRELTVHLVLDAVERTEQSRSARQQVLGGRAPQRERPRRRHPTRVDVAGHGVVLGGGSAAPGGGRRELRQHPAGDRVRRLSSQTPDDAGQPTAGRAVGHIGRSVPEQHRYIEVAGAIDLPVGLQVGQPGRHIHLRAQERRGGTQCLQRAHRQRDRLRSLGGCGTRGGDRRGGRCHLGPDQGAVDRRRGRCSGPHGHHDDRRGDDHDSCHGQHLAPRPVVLAVRAVQHRREPVEPVGRLAQRGRDLPGLGVERHERVPRRGRGRPGPAVVRVRQDAVRLPLGSLHLIGGLPHRPGQPPRGTAVAARRLRQVEDLRLRERRLGDRRHRNNPRSSSRTHEATAARPVCSCR